jgi:competence protein ComEC
MIEIAALIISFGAILYHSFDQSLGMVMVASLMLAIFLCLTYYSKRGALFAVSLGIACMLGAVIMHVSHKPIQKELFGERIIDAQILSVDRRLEKTILIVKDTEFKQKVRVSMYGYDVLPGDHVSVKGTIMPPEDFATDTGRIFPYEQYMESKGIAGTVNRAQVALLEAGSFSLPRVATVIRHGIADTFATYVSFPVDGILSGMLVGYQGNVPEHTKDLFRDTGVLHTLVLSGYNIMLLAGFLALILSRMPFHLRIALTISFIIILVLVSGSGVASIRAGIMGSIALLSGLALRTYRPLRALVLTYLLFFFISPLTIFSDPGFHLSFLATLFMILVLPRISTGFTFLPATKHVNIRELLLLALCIPLFMLPYTMYFSGVMPLATIPANIMLALLIPLLMMLGIVLLFVSWLAPLASVIGIFVSFLGNGMYVMLEYVSRMPIINTPTLSWWGVICIYAVFLCILFRKEIMKYRERLRNLLGPQTNSFDS